MKIKLKLFLAIILCSVFVSTIFVSQRVDAVAITVKRVIFEGPKRAEVITVINNSDTQETYRMGWRHYEMTENKALIAVDEENLPDYIKPSKDMVRFSPRRFTLPPRGSQQVRMMLRLPGDVEEGEYRSHLWIRPEADVQAYRKESERLTKAGKTGVTMKMLAGVSMPIIVRKGKLDATAEIKNLAFKNKGDHIEATFVLGRTGNRSVYGDLDFVCNMGQSNEYLIKFLRGISVYTDVPYRNMVMKVLPKEGKAACNNITLRYTETDGFKGDAISILSEVSAPVQ